MKRQDFILKVGFLGVGLSLAPWKLVSAKPSPFRYTLPKASVHIPHGNFAAAELEKRVIPEFGLECTVQHFMRNGIEPSSGDLTVCSFRRGEQLLLIAVGSDDRSFIEGEIAGLTIEVPSADCAFFTLLEK